MTLDEDMEDMDFEYWTLCFEHAKMKYEIKYDENPGMYDDKESWLDAEVKTPQAPVERGEKPEVILANIQKHLPSWAEAVYDMKD